jgi:SAM-dependent methyltransferase
MSTELVFDGERFVPGAPGEIVYEHVHRYAFASRFAAGRRVLDAASGEGYGSALLAEVAAEVTGIDVDPAAVAHAAQMYRGRGNVLFVAASVASLPLRDASVDLVVSFETIEHLEARLQPAMLAEFARVLAPDGVLLLSSPNRPEYSERRNYANPFHLHELDRDELAALLTPHFPATRWFGQRIWLGSLLRAEDAADDARATGGVESWEGNPAGVAPSVPTEPLYFVVLAARSAAALGAAHVSTSLFSDRENTEFARTEHHAREVLRLDALALEQRATLDRQTGHIQHLEVLVAERDRAIGERDSRLNAARAENERLERALAAQERLIAYQRSLRGWLAQPWVRLRLVLRRVRGLR